MKRTGERWRATFAQERIRNNKGLDPCPAFPALRRGRVGSMWGSFYGTTGSRIGSMRTSSTTAARPEARLASQPERIASIGTRSWVHSPQPVQVGVLYGKMQMNILPLPPRPGSLRMRGRGSDGPSSVGDSRIRLTEAYESPIAGRPQAPGRIPIPPSLCRALQGRARVPRRRLVKVCH